MSGKNSTLGVGLFETGLFVVAAAATAGGVVYYHVQQSSAERLHHEQDSVPLIVTNDAAATNKNQKGGGVSYSFKKELSVMTPEFVAHPLTGVHYQFVHEKTLLPQSFIPMTMQVESNVDNSIIVRAFLQLKDVILTPIHKSGSTGLTYANYHVYQDQVSTTKLDSGNGSFQMIHFLKVERKWTVSDQGFYVYLQYTCQYDFETAHQHQILVDDASIFWDQDIDETSNDLTNVQAGSYQVNQSVLTNPFIPDSHSTVALNHNIVRVIAYDAPPESSLVSEMKTDHQNRYSYTVIQRPIKQYKNRFGLPMLLTNVKDHQFFTLFYPYWNDKHSSIVIQRSLFVDDRHCLVTEQSLLYYLDITRGQLTTMEENQHPKMKVYPILTKKDPDTTGTNVVFIISCFVIQWEPRHNPNMPITYILMMCRNHTSVSSQDRYYVYGQAAIQPKDTKPQQGAVVSETMRMQLNKKTYEYQISIRNLGTIHPVSFDCEKIMII